MKVFKIKGSTGESTIYTGEKLKNVFRYIPVEKTIIITDSNVAALYHRDFPPCPVITIGVGEKIKTLDTVREIYGKLVELEAQRSCFILGIGGGIVCDITGFVASTYLRGVGFGFVSTTLLSQVDASVGGKNGVNFEGYKNMVGVFNQPEFVICDMELLKTLAENELINGFGEIVKHAAIGDSKMFSYLETHFDQALALKTDVIEKLVYDSIVIKAGVVNRDEKEAGERRKLNFGHTFGHAIEKTQVTSHGKAISVGMVVAAALSVNRGLLSPEKATRITNLLEKLKLPVRCDLDTSNVLDALKKDKKREGDLIHFILLEDIGKAVIQKISIEELQNLLQNI
ncbi:MAG: 3-dehydroquinate synthase [Desulfobacterales bacterium]